MIKILHPSFTRWNSRNCSKSRIHVVYVNDPQRVPSSDGSGRRRCFKGKGNVPESLLENLDIIYAAPRGTRGGNRQIRQEHQIDLIIVGHKHRSKIYSSMFDSEDVNH